MRPFCDSFVQVWNEWLSTTYLYFPQPTSQKSMRLAEKPIFILQFHPYIPQLGISEAYGATHDRTTWMTTKISHRMSCVSGRPQHAKPLNVITLKMLSRVIHCKILQVVGCWAAALHPDQSSRWQPRLRALCLLGQCFDGNSGAPRGWWSM